ncbi:uncharacterized protein LOC135194143 [Vanessa tameamea]|uniref:Uncharacterized protein LOC135194143 n=1 Tax=Vanessa tameamea TaxID=334116 RepID=A0ABM4AUX0_VANTA
MRYLGLILDGRWSFGQQFVQLSPKLINSAAALGRLLPNVGGPETPCRRLYAGVVRSMALYGAPIWVDPLTARNKALLRRSQRVIAVRAIRGYRTVSWTAATLLASDPPWELQAEVLAEVYCFRVEARASGDCPELVEVKRVRPLAQRALIRRWEEWVPLGMPGDSGGYPSPLESLGGTKTRHTLIQTDAGAYRALLLR